MDCGTHRFHRLRQRGSFDTHNNNPSACTPFATSLSNSLPAHAQHKLAAPSRSSTLLWHTLPRPPHLPFDWQQQLRLSGNSSTRSDHSSCGTESMGLTAPDAVAAEGPIKYHLVEAEEVGHKPHGATATARTAKPKRKSKFNWSQVPVEGDEVATIEKRQESGRSSVHKDDTRSDGWPRGRHFDLQQSRSGGGDPRTGGRYGGRRQHGDSHGSFYNGVYVPTPDVTVTAHWAKDQIEFYFTCDNLVRDIFLRQHMDVDGYVPLAFVGSFQAVYSIHQDYESLFEAMKHSKTIELDEQNEKIRLRTGWEKWVWPNTNGGYGVPRYVKQKTDEAVAA